MPFGAHETMEAHEFLEEKLNMMNHFHIYRMQAQDPALRQMIERHLDDTVRAYNQLVSYTHNYQPVNPVSAQTPSTVHAVQQTQPNQIQYGLNQPAPHQPVFTTTTLNDRQISSALLQFHKTSAINSIHHSLECADPNVRQIMVNTAVNCSHLAYEVFQYMNQRGYYQVPTMKDHTAKTLLHSYQNAPQYQAAPTGATTATGATYNPTTTVEGTTDTNQSREQIHSPTQQHPYTYNQ